MRTEGLAIALPLPQRVQDVPLPFPAVTSMSQNTEIADLFKTSKPLHCAPQTFPEAAVFPAADSQPPFFLPATSDTCHEPTQTSTDRCSTGGGRAPFPPMGALQQQGRSRARGEHTHSTHCTRGEHKCLQQNLRESTLRESSSPAPPALPSPAGLDPPSTHPSPFPVLFLPELKNDSEASAGQPVWDTAAGEALRAVGSKLCRKSGHTSAFSQSKDHSGTLGYFPLTGLWEKPTKT